jgi:hypothetical protein
MAHQFLPHQLAPANISSPLLPQLRPDGGSRRRAAARFVRATPRLCSLRLGMGTWRRRCAPRITVPQVRTDGGIVAAWLVIVCMLQEADEHVCASASDLTTSFSLKKSTCFYSPRCVHDQLQFLLNTHRAKYQIRFGTY